MRINQLKSSVRPHVIARKIRAKNIPIRSMIFTLTGFVAGSMLVFAMLNGPAVDEEPTAALFTEKLAESGIEIAALPQTSLSDAELFVMAATKEAKLSASVADTTAEALPTPAPERFSLTPPDMEEAVGVIRDAAISPSVEVANTDEQVQEIELRLAEAGDPNFILPPAKERTDGNTDENAELDDGVLLPEPQGEGSSDSVAAQATRYVNLRGAPDNDSDVIRVIPAGDAISVEGNCEGWCTVIHQGTRGYVYESFISVRES